MNLIFRNIVVDPSAPAEGWGFEGLLSAVDRGEAADWNRISAAVRNDPWGRVARLLEDQVLPAAEDTGVAHALCAMISLHRERWEAHERAAVAAELQELVSASGLTQQEFATSLGTSRTRLSTYLSGKVVPAATLMVRARCIAESQVSQQSQKSQTR